MEDVFEVLWLYWAFFWILSVVAYLCYLAGKRLLPLLRGFGRWLKEHIFNEDSLIVLMIFLLPFWLPFFLLYQLVKYLIWGKPPGDAEPEFPL